MENEFSYANLRDEIIETYKKEVNNFEKQVFGINLRINRSRIRDIASFMAKKGANLMNLIINDLGERYELVYEYYFKALKESNFWFLITLVSKVVNEIDSIGGIFPHAKFYEQEITKRFGFIFRSFIEKEERSIFSVPFLLKPKNSKRNLLPMGIYNKIHNNNYYFHLEIENDKIVSVSEKTGWLYRGIIPLMHYKDLFEDNIRLTKRICHTSSFHHNIAYILAIEQIANIHVQNRVNLIRTLFCEFERFENHLLWFINLFYLLNHSKASLLLLKKSFELTSLYEKYFHCHFLDDSNSLGYIQDISFEDLKEIYEISDQFLPKIIEQINLKLYNKNIEKKIEGLGLIPKDKSFITGVTGPCLRACGIDYDIRKTKPYLSYSDKEILQILDKENYNKGDVFARSETRLGEMNNSKMIIKTIIEKIVEDKSKIEPLETTRFKLPSEAIGISQLESPHGELLYYIKTADHPGLANLANVYISTPSLKNFTALNSILINEMIPNFQLIVHSMDLNFYEIDL